MEATKNEISIKNNDCFHWESSVQVFENNILYKIGIETFTLYIF